MPNSLPTNNTPASISDAIIAAANSAGVTLVKSLIIADQPWMGDPIISALLGDILGWLDGYLAKAEEAGATFIINDIQTSTEEQNVENDAAAVLAAEKARLPDAVKIAIIAYAKANSALINSDGITPIG